MSDTHPDRVLREYGTWLDQARALAMKTGWQSYMELLEPSAHPPTKDMMYLGKALIHANMERVFKGMSEPYDYSKFSREKGIAGFFGWMEHKLLEAGQDPAELRTNISANMAMMWHVVCHTQNGSQTFEVTPGLAERLGSTKLNGLATEDLKLPYKAPYIQMPSNTGLRVWNYHTEWHKVDGVYLVESTDQRGRAWRFMVVGKSKNPEDEFDDALFYFCVPLPPGMDVAEALDKEENRVMKVYSGDPYVEKYKTEWRDLFNWVMNAMVYATCSNVRQEVVVQNKEARQLIERMSKLPKGDKRDALRERLKQLDQRRRTILGVGIQPFSDAEKAPYTRGELRVRTLVEGFYRNQTYGPKNSLRRNQWIEPFWRPRLGEEDLPTSTPTHVLK
jgi:roadblock/LC7 domain-containing protein